MDTTQSYLSDMCGNNDVINACTEILNQHFKELVDNYGFKIVQDEYYVMLYKANMWIIGLGTLKDRTRHFNLYSFNGKDLILKDTLPVDLIAYVKEKHEK